MAASSTTVAPGATGHSAQAASASHSSGATAGQRQQVRRQAGDERGATEVRERDRGGRERAGERDRERVAQPQWHGRPLEPGAERRREAVDGRHRHERELKARSERSPRDRARGRPRRRAPAGARGRAPSRSARPARRGRRSPPRARPRGRLRRPPRRRRPPGSRTRGRARAAARRPRRARAPRRRAGRCCRPIRPAGARARRRGTPPASRRRARRCRPARRPSRCAQPGRRRRLPARRARPRRSPIERPREAAPPPDLDDAPRRQRLVHALARQPRPAVEVAARGRHRGQRSADLEDRALPERPAGAQLDRMAVQRRDRGAAERARPRLAVTTTRAESTCPTSERSGSAARARCRAPTRPRPASAHMTAAPAVSAARRPARSAPGRAAQAPTSARPIAPEPASAGRASPVASHGAAASADLVDADAARHSASRGRSASRRSGPMPLTSSSSSTERNPPQRYELSNRATRGFVCAQCSSFLQQCLARSEPQFGSALLFGVADERIPGVHQELHALDEIFGEIKRYSDEAATTEVLRSNAAGADVIHLACHAQFRSDNPLFSGLKNHRRCGLAAFWMLRVCAYWRAASKRHCLSSVHGACSDSSS